MLAALWVRLILLIAFVIFVAVQQMWLLAGIGIILIAVTVWQLAGVYRQRGDNTSQ
ncbi:hypothetical protein [Corynebacterium yudongzhengii]|uniref:hypothetical protein n=1 Tax=Corynebacterium yudongzhengii TaxID=2080740 RepID=UPI0018EE5017|nr:hypothetical protein [Corynebacterium yudongzhengii]